MQKQTQLSKLLQILSDGLWHSGEELATEVGWRFGAVVHQARNKGFDIETSMLGHKQYQYRLVKF